MPEPRTDDCVIIIFGASGDLTSRKLIPALFSLSRRDLMPDRFSILGVGRTPYTDTTYRARLAEALVEPSVADFAPADGEHTESKRNGSAEEFLERVFYQDLDTSDTGDFVRLDDRIRELNAAIDGSRNFLFYLSTPPSLFGPIVQGLGRYELEREGNGDGWKRLIVEKPFGYDLASAGELDRALHEVFSERQIFRIDHYLGKETVQNLLVLRFGNGIFEPLWNRNFIDRVEVTAAESIGIESRGGYYERSGALRDMFQNHLLHVVGMIAMEPPATINAASVRNETMKVFESIRKLTEEDMLSSVVRGQYVASTVRGEAVAGYRDEEGVDPASKTETYVAVRFFIDNWRWADVPFLVRTGKRLPTRVTEAVIHFRRAPHRLFEGATPDDRCDECNQLIIRIQPDEGILVKFNMKLPGSGFRTKTVSMDFHYSDLSDVYTPQAYERLLLDCMIGDATLYARNDAVEACWRFVDPILDYFKNHPDFPLHGYPALTWGPPQSRELLGSSGLDWRFPCKNLAADGEYCEL